MDNWSDRKKRIASIGQSESDALDNTSILISALTRRREELGLSREDVSKRCEGIPVGIIERIENGVFIAGIDTLYRLVGALGMELTLTIRDKKEME